MKNYNNKQIIKKLGTDERCNVCPQCGNEVCLFINAEGEYCIGCANCEDHNFSTYLTHNLNEYEMDLFKKCWNVWATGNIYSPGVLENLNVRNGDYIATSSTDSYIDFFGKENDMFAFLTEKSKLDKCAVYSIYCVLEGKLYNIGISTLVDLALKNYKVER